MSSPAVHLVAVLFAVVGIAGCQMRDEGHAAGAVATAAPQAAVATAVGSTRAEKIGAATKLAPYPNGGVLLGDSSKCVVSRVHDTTRWTRPVGPCQDIVEVAVAYDSMAIVRTGTTLHGFDPEGNEAWKVQLQGSVARDIAAPAVTRDSMAVIAHSPQLVVGYRKGQEAWRSVLPASEALVSSPLGSQTEGVLLASANGVTALGADGSVRWSTSAAKAAK